MQLFFHDSITEDRFTLEAEESRHLTKVLRKSQGDKVNFTDGKGFLYQCTILEPDPKKTLLQVNERLYTPEDDFYIHLAISPTKNIDRMEWMVEKITEVGVHEITFMQSEHTERNHLKLDRLEKKLIAACKQSLKTRVPKLNPVRPMEELLADKKFDTYERFIAYLDQENDRHLFEKTNPNKAYLVLIGPEGDFSKQEIELALSYHFLPCSLGRSRLRTETAGLVTVQTLQMKNTINL